MEPSAKLRAMGWALHFAPPFLSCEGGREEVVSSQHLRNGAMMLVKERENKGKPFLSSSTLSTGSVPDYFQEILEHPQLIKLWQHPEKLERKLYRSWQGRELRSDVISPFYLGDICISR